MKSTLLATTLVVLSAVSANAATLINGSFETTPTPIGASGFDLYTAIDGWTAGVDQNIEVQTVNAIGLGAQDGNNYVELASDSAASISQEVFLSAGQYELSFFYSPRERDRNGLGLNNMAFGVGGVFSEDVLNAPNLDLPRGEWTEIAEVFEIATDGLYTVFFQGTDPTDGSRGALIDNITLAAVPLPAAGLMLLTALGAAAAGRRKR